MLILRVELMSSATVQRLEAVRLDPELHHVYRDRLRHVCSDLL
jgi:hypothetical protein